MRHQPTPPSPKDRPDHTLLAMIVSTGLLIAWAYSATRGKVDLDLQSGISPIIPALLGAD
ncbi:hypothetical protein [Luteolibacter soli]|uniref:Uncharacterized protein n=1 Tax=Luteolibacter soli TaxID=3135280 RepID=A0ABU9AP47_9BACT